MMVGPGIVLASHIQTGLDRTVFRVYHVIVHMFAYLNNLGVWQNSNVAQGGNLNIFHLR